MPIKDVEISFPQVLDALFSFFVLAARIVWSPVRYINQIGLKCVVRHHPVDCVNHSHRHPPVRTCVAQGCFAKSTD